MYAKKINNTWVKFQNLPTIWEDKSPFNPENEGFHVITTPSITSSEKLGGVIDDLNGKPIYDITPSIQTQSTLSQEEIEIRLYQKRISEGVNTWAKISAKLRLYKENGELTLEKYKQIEKQIKPFREELLAGQWVDAQILINQLFLNDIGEDLYFFITTTLDTFILDNY